VSVGSRLKRRYDAPQTPLDRLRTSQEADPSSVAQLLEVRQKTDPFALPQSIEQKLDRIAALANRRERSDRVTSQMA
jgi:hypothetical protein